MPFDIIYGWRKWRGQRGIWITLLLSLCFFCCVTGLVTNLFWQLSSDKPRWVGNTKPMITLGSRDFNGQFQPITGYEIDLLQSLSGVEAVASLTLNSVKLDIDLEQFNNVSVGFYSDGFATLLGLGVPFSKQVYAKKQAILSHDFWMVRLKGDPSWQSKTYRYNASTLPVANIAPKGMGQFGLQKVDIWLPDSLLRKTVPSMFNDNPDLFLKTQGNRFGFAQVASHVDSNDLVRAYLELRDVTPLTNGGFSDRHFSPWVIAGVELNPVGRSQILRQTYVMLILVSGFGFIIFSTYLALFSQQSISRIAEMQLKITLGAEYRTLAKKLLLENIPLLVMLLGVSPLMAYFLLDLVASMPIYKAYFHGELSFNYWTWLLAICLSLTSFIACALMPLWRLKSHGFSRARQANMSKGQYRLSQFTSILQMAVILVMSVVAIGLSLKEWQKRQDIAVAEDVYTLTPEVNGRLSLVLNAKQVEGEWILGREPAALSYKEFTDLGSRSLSYRVSSETASESIPVNDLYISENFFGVLGGTMLVEGELSEDTIVLNETMAKKLASQLSLVNWKEVIGIELTVNGFYYERSFRVAAVVEDFAHFGLVEKTMPVIYLHLRALNPLYSHRLAPVVYSRSEDKTLVQSQLNDWAALQSTGLTYRSPIAVKKAVLETNLAGDLLYVTSSIMALLTCVLAIVSLYYKQSYIIKSQQTKLAVMLAVGASKRKAMLISIKGNVMLAMLACLLALLGLFMIQARVETLLQFALVQPWVLLLTFVGLIFIVSIMNLIISKLLLANSIKSLLAGN